MRLVLANSTLKKTSQERVKKRQWVDPIREQKGIYSKYVHLPLKAYTAAVLYYAWLLFII